MSDAAPASRRNDNRIVALMVLFTVAIAFDVVAISGLAAVGGWWMLGMAFAVHLVASAIVFVEVADVLAGRTRRLTPRRSRRQARR